MTAPATELWLIRHGPTHARAMIGWTDLPADLSDTAALARLAGRLPLAPVVSSDLVRAISTADAVQGARPRLANESALREMYFGAWEGRTHAEAEAQNPALARALWEKPGDTAPPGGESWNDFAARCCTAIDGLIAVQGPGPLIIVAHFGVILSQVQRARGISAVEAFAQPIANLSLTRIAHDAGGWTVREVNALP
jgi:broad specificity phosphatase PhoE